ncbi:MAG TPA: hypothetical protein VFO07_06800 [Roseiflexaceae bacterium]|nr:hypothetical protein [Roseiflexaceae bacterium]
MLDELTNESFTPHVGTQFRFRIDAETWVTTELIEATERRSSVARAAWAAPANPLREPFSIVFRGPQSPLLRQGMYRVEHDTLGVIEDLFIVPVGVSREGIFYEAVFS